MYSEKTRNRIAAWGRVLVFAVLSSIPFLFEGCGFIALVCIAPLFCLEELCRKKEIRHRGWYYFTAFYLFNIGSTYWIWYVSPAGAFGALTVNTLFMTVLFRFFTLARSLCAKAGRENSILPYIFFILIWTAWEHVYFDIELSWPWLTLGNAFASSPKLIQWYEISGVEGGTLWIMFSGLTIFLAIKNYASGRAKMARLCAAGALAVTVLPAALSLCRYHSYREEGEEVEMAAAQPNIDPFDKYGILPQSALDDRLLELLDSVVTPYTRYVFTPETFTYDINLDAPEKNASLRKFSNYVAQHEGMSMLFGSMTIQPYHTAERPTASARKTRDGWLDFYNSALMIDGSGKLSLSHKSKLVPGVEIIPYQNLLPFLGDIFDKFGGGMNSYGRSGRMVPLKGADGHVAAPMVCYESIYGDYASRAVRDGADFLAVITNDGWWGDSPGYHQHFRYARLRAIENRRDLIHVANNGISGFINQRGDVLSATPYWIETAIIGKVHTTDHLSFFSKHGDIAGRAAFPASMAVLAIMIALRAWDRKSSRGKSAGDRI